MTRLTIVRHGNTFDKGDIVTRVGARTDLSLSQSGRVQALALQEHFSSQNIDFDMAYCSCLKRTKETADLIREGTKTPEAEVLGFLTEIDYGPDENKPEDDVIKRIGTEAIEKWEHSAIPPDGWLVNPSQLQEAWITFFENISLNYTGKRILVVTSNGIARFALLALGQENKFDLKLKTGAYGELHIHNSGDIDLLKWNIRP